jgi:hypothetical protein
VPFKANQDRRRHIPRQRYQVTNWPAYDAALRQRGSLTVWFSEAAIAAWDAERRITPGGQPRYSALAIATALTLRAVFRLALRQTEGLIGSIIRLLGLDLAVPDHSTLSRRAETLQLVRPAPSTEPVHLLVEKHGARTRRSWKKLHLGVDADTGEIIATTLTSHDVDDGSQVGPLLDQVRGPVASFTGDGASTGTTCTTRSRRVILMRPSSCRRARTRCRAARQRPRRRSGTDICSLSPDMVG